MPCSSRPAGSGRRRRRGQSLAEFALIAPFLLLLVVGGTDLARAYFVGIQVADGARQGALYAADNPGATAAQIETVAQENTASNGSGLAPGLLGCPTADVTPVAQTVGADPNAPGFLDERVSVTCALPLLTPLLPSPVTISATATGLVLIGALTVDSSVLADGTVGAPYSQTLQASGGIPPYTWSIPSGALPAGLSLSSAGVISGTPTAAGTTSVTVEVADSASPQDTATGTITITVTASGITIAPSTIPAATATVAYTPVSLAATGGTAPYSWTITSGSLPAGMSLSAAGTISGTPTTAGTATFTVQVTDSGSPAQSATQTYTLKVALDVPAASLPNGKRGKGYGTSVPATPVTLPTPQGGTAPYTWSVTSGSLPPGLTLAAASGGISGTPTATGTFTFTVTAGDSATPANTGTQTYSITVSP